jgi:hypothetical protein
VEARRAEVHEAGRARVEQRRRPGD